MDKAIDLLKRLGIVYYTKRHLSIINEFIDNKETDCENLLTKLGSWTQVDLLITQKWFKEL